MRNKMECKTITCQPEIMYFLKCNQGNVNFSHKNLNVI